jgi:hypothetical protein
MRPEEMTQSRLGELIIALTEEIVWLVEDEERSQPIVGSAAL